MISYLLEGKGLFCRILERFFWGSRSTSYQSSADRNIFWLWGHYGDVPCLHCLSGVPLGCPKTPADIIIIIIIIIFIIIIIIIIITIIIFTIIIFTIIIIIIIISSCSLFHSLKGNLCCCIWLVMQFIARHCGGRWPGIWPCQMGVSVPFFFFLPKTIETLSCSYNLSLFPGFLYGHLGYRKCWRTWRYDFSMLERKWAPENSKITRSSCEGLVWDVDLEFEGYPP